MRSCVRFSWNPNSSNLGGYWGGFVVNLKDPELIEVRVNWSGHPLQITDFIDNNKYLP